MATRKRNTGAQVSFTSFIARPPGARPPGRHPQFLLPAAEQQNGIAQRHHNGQDQKQRGVVRIAGAVNIINGYVEKKTCTTIRIAMTASARNTEPRSVEAAEK